MALRLIRSQQAATVRKAYRSPYTPNGHPNSGGDATSYPGHISKFGYAPITPRFHVDYTPTYSSWLNQVERGFGIITQQAIRRDNFRSVRALVPCINEFVQHYNRNSRPFVWTVTADSIFQKLSRLCSYISGPAH